MRLTAFDEGCPTPICTTTALNFLEAQVLGYLRRQGVELENGDPLGDKSRLCFIPKGETLLLVYLIDDAKVFDTGIQVKVESDGAVG